ncbi:MAG: DASS family sodium-coupled anion symporter [Actinomycetia bacterium]|nr:DASS family sodium-coupled anion symporter [Actinomycetes bacterium]
MWLLTDSDREKDDPDVVVDSRPLGRVLLSRSYRWLAFIGLGLLFWILLAWPTPAGLTVDGQRALAAFVICLILWLTRLIPLAVTSLLAITLIQLLGVMESGEAFALFGNQAVFFILGAFILAAALMKTGLSSRIALFFLSKFGGSPKQLLLGALIVPAFLSFWMPEHAVAAMLFPIIIEIVRALRTKPRTGNFGHAIFLSLAWGAAIGGVGTFLGGARNALAVGILKQTTGQFIGFFEWMIAVVPMVFAMLIIAYFVINRFFPSDIDSVEEAVDVLKKRNKQMGKPSIEERMVGLIMLLTVAAWVFLGSAVELASIAIVAVVSLFVFQLVKWRDLEGYVNWGIILMYGGAIALGFALEDTGAAAWLAQVLITRWTTSPMIIIIVLAFISILLTEGMSNAAVVAMLVPVGLGIADTHGIDPRVIVFAIAVPAGLGFAIPMGNPPNAIAYSSGYIDPKRMLKVGLLLDLCAWVVFVLMAKYYWPLINIRI